MKKSGGGGGGETAPGTTDSTGTKKKPENKKRGKKPEVPENRDSPAPGPVIREAMGGMVVVAQNRSHNNHRPASKAFSPLMSPELARQLMEQKPDDFVSGPIRINPKNFTDCYVAHPATGRAARSARQCGLCPAGERADRRRSRQHRLDPEPGGGQCDAVFGQHAVAGE